MNTYEVRTQDGEPLVGIVTEQAAKAVLDRSEGVLIVGETDRIGRFNPHGMRGSVGYDPLLPPPVLVVLDMEGREVHRAEVPERGSSDPSEVLMPPEDEAQ
jgi:hypothetical protein